MVTTSKGHIYKIICKVDEKFCYIGSTFDRLSKRMERHRFDYNHWVKGKREGQYTCFSYFQKYGFENFKIVLIKSYEVCREHNKDTKHLRAYETLWINKTKCVNKNIPIDYLKKDKWRHYREDNRDKINAKKREKDEKNRDENNEKAREKVKCKFCGCIMNKSSIRRHQKKVKKCLEAQGK